MGKNAEGLSTMFRRLACFCACFLFPFVGYAGNGGLYLSPNGKLAISTAPGATPSHFKVQLIDADTEEVLGSYDPETRAIEVFWSPDNRFVAINEDISHATGNLGVWLVKDRQWKPVSLPARLLDQVVTDKASGTSRSNEVIDRLLPRSDASQVKFWWGSHQPTAHQWRTASDLEITVGGEAALKDNRTMAVSYLFVVRFYADSSAKILGEKRLDFSIKPAQPQ